MRTATTGQIGRHLADLPGPAPRVVLTGNFATPRTLLRLLDEHLPAYELFSLNAQHPMPDRPGVVHVTPFVGPGVRRCARLRYVPARLSLVPALFRAFFVPELVLLHTTPPHQGRVSLGVEVNILPAAVEAARRAGALVVAQVNPQMPWTFGDAEMDTDLIDLSLEVDEPLTYAAPAVPSPVSAAIAERVAGLVTDGACLQLGIGAVPDSTLAALRTRRGLSVWSEMFSDGVLTLDRAGALAPDRPIVSSFLLGSRELHDWVDRNPRVHMLRTETTNDPARIARQDSMTSVNAALEVDLFAQANASWVGGRVYSGFGGQTDFTVGALHACRGQAILALPSWHPKTDCSTIVPRLHGPATSFQHSWIVTEQGEAAIWPRTQQEQTTGLIHRAAHPRARAELAEQAAGLGLLGAGP